MPRKVQQIPDYFTGRGRRPGQAAPSYPTRMAFRIMLKTGLRVSEALALRRVDLRLDQDPPIIVVRADSPGNKAARAARSRCRPTWSRACTTWRHSTTRTGNGRCWTCRDGA